VPTDAVRTLAAIGQGGVYVLLALVLALLGVILLMIVAYKCGVSEVELRLQLIGLRIRWSQNTPPSRIEPEKDLNGSAEAPEGSSDSQ
jgi:hypothetical protein